MRRNWLNLLLICLAAIVLPSCGSSQQLIGIQVTPNAVVFGGIDPSLFVQLTATGTYVHPPATKNLTNQVTWTSDTVQVAQSFSGLATAVGCGSSSCATTITASATSLSGSIVVGQATLTVSPGSAPQQRTLSAINIVPGAGTQTLETLGETAQFIAIGTYTASPTTVT